MKPLISIIIPVYNVDKYLVRALTSIVNQTLRNKKYYVLMIAVQIIH